MNSRLKIKFSKPGTKTRTWSTDLTFNSFDLVPFFTKQQEHCNEFTESPEKIISEENSVFDEPFHLTDKTQDQKRDILYLSKDPLKSSKIIMFWSGLVTLFVSCFERFGCISDKHL